MPPFWSHNADSCLALCDSKFNIAGIEAPVLKFMTILETLTMGHLEKLYDLLKPKDPDCYMKLCTQIKVMYAKGHDDSEKFDLFADLALGN